MFKKGLVILISGLLCGAFAVPMTLEDIIGLPGSGVYTDNEAEYAVLTDTDGKNDDATAFMFLEIAGFRNDNTFGIYDFTDDGLGNITLGDQLEVFDGAAAPSTTPFPTSITLEFDLDAGVVTNKTTGITANIDQTFGFYLTAPAESWKQYKQGTPVMQTYYSHTSLNDDNFDHFQTFNTKDNSVSGLGGVDAVIAMEDLKNGGDRDYNDMVIGMSDVDVPEPGILSLLGIGLLALVWRKRR